MRRLLAACLAVIALAASAGADEGLRRAVDDYLADAGSLDDAVPGDLARLAAIADDARAEPWTFTAAIYLWAAGIEGDIGADGGTASIDVPFSEIFDDLSGAFMGRFAARKGKWGVLADFFWCALEESTTGPIGGTIRAEMDLFIVELTGSYAIVTARAEDDAAPEGADPKGLFTLDLYAGARVYSVDVEITTTLLSREQTETWVDPIVGLDALYRTGRWAFGLRADIGGFEISSELAWSVTAEVAFRCSRVLWLAAGYRLLDVDFESGGSPFMDVQLSGPFFAVAFHW